MASSGLSLNGLGLFVETESEKSKADKVRNLLESTNTDLKALQSLSFSGLPSSVRGTSWKLLAVRKGKRGVVSARN